MAVPWMIAWIRKWPSSGNQDSLRGQEEAAGNDCMYREMVGGGGGVGSVGVWPVSLTLVEPMRDGLARERGVSGG